MATTRKKSPIGKAKDIHIDLLMSLADNPNQTAAELGVKTDVLYYLETAHRVVTRSGVLHRDQRGRPPLKWKLTQAGRGRVKRRRVAAAKVVQPVAVAA